MKKTYIVLIAILSVFFVGANVSAEPVIEVDISPEEPVVASEVSFTVTITDEKEIDEVYLEVQECKDTLCFKVENVTMTHVNNNYQKQYQLSRDESTLFKYSIAILFADGTWYNQTQKTEVGLKPDAGNGGTNGGTTDGDKKTPGFELILVLAAVSVGLVLLKRKR